jgi:hypothetical protein
MCMYGIGWPYTWQPQVICNVRLPLRPLLHNRTQSIGLPSDFANTDAGHWAHPHALSRRKQSTGLVIKLCQEKSRALGLPSNFVKEQAEHRAHPQALPRRKQRTGLTLTPCQEETRAYGVCIFNTDTELNPKGRPTYRCSMKVNWKVMMVTMGCTW